MMRLLAALSAVLAIASIVRYEKDESARSAAQQFVRDFEVTARRPAEVATLPLVPAADLGADVVSEIALSDTFGTVHLADATPELRETWFRAIGRLTLELESARSISLDALETRPGWPRHWSNLGQLTYALQRRGEGSPDARLWQEPLGIGIESFPGNDEGADFAASAYLETWPELTDAARAGATRCFKRALLDNGFSARNFPLLISAIGPDEAIAMLPSNPLTLRSAFESFARAGEIAHAATIYRRWEQEEWRARTSELQELIERAKLGDVERQRQLAQDWVSRHQAGEFDTPAGREQVLRVLQLAVNDRVGSWTADPRAGAVRFLMNRRMSPRSGGGGHGIETAPGGSIVATVVASMTGVPEPVRARTHLLGGDVEGAQSIFERSDSAGSFEWTPFLLDLAEYRLASGASDAARTALDALAPAAQKECDVLALRQRIAALEGGTAANNALQQLSFTPSSWSSTGVLSICFDPDDQSSRQLMTWLDSPGPALISWGWNDGRHGSTFINAGHTYLRVSAADRRGRQAFFVKTLAGGPVTPGETTIVK